MSTDTMKLDAFKPVMPDENRWRMLPYSHIASFDFNDVNRFFQLARDFGWRRELSDDEFDRVYFQSELTGISDNDARGIGAALHAVISAVRNKWIAADQLAEVCGVDINGICEFANFVDQGGCAAIVPLV